MDIDQYLLIPFLGGWTSIYQLFWGSLGTRVLTHCHMQTSRHTATEDDTKTRPQSDRVEIAIPNLSWESHDSPDSDTDLSLKLQKAFARYNWVKRRPGNCRDHEINHSWPTDSRFCFTHAAAIQHHDLRNNWSCHRSGLWWSVRRLNPRNDGSLSWKTAYKNEGFSSKHAWLAEAKWFIFVGL